MTQKQTFPSFIKELYFNKFFVNFLSTGMVLVGLIFLEFMLFSLGYAFVNSIVNSIALLVNTYCIWYVVAIITKMFRNRYVVKK